MKLEIIVFLVILCQPTEPYDTRCPYSSEWNLRAIANCTSAANYTCLYNQIYNIYSESCDPIEPFVRKGWKKVRNLRINQVECSSDRYQPFIFTTRGNSDCVLDKSFCNGEGQVIANNGSTSTDRSCRCDYTKGYTYITTPVNVYSCLPSEEDCPCYLKHCPFDRELTADYKCFHTGNFVSLIFPDIRKSTDASTHKSPYVNDTDNISETNTYARKAAVDILIIIVIYIVLHAMIFINVRPYLLRPSVKYKDALIIEIYDDPFTYEVMPGDVLTIEWKLNSLLPVKSIICKKDGDAVKDIELVVCKMKGQKSNSDNDKYTLNWSDESATLSLKITEFKSEDAGTYTCTVTNVVHLTNTSADSCLNVLPCKQSIVGIRKYMQYFPMIRLDVRNQIKLCVGSMPTEIQNVVVIKDSMAKLEVLSMENITSVKWFRCHNKNLTSISDADKYSGGSTTTPSLSIKITELEQAGIYVCLVKRSENDNSAFRYKLKVMPQEKIYQEILKHRNDSCFVKTSTVHKAFRSLCDHGLVIITGREGTGKSKMCLELASLSEEMDFLPFVLDIQKCAQADLVGTKMLYIIDNIRFDKESCDQLHKILPLLQCTEQRWIIITCRTSELLSLEGASQKTNKFKSELVMDVDNSLLQEEKFQILQAHLDKNTLSIDKILSESVKKIISSEPYYGFPLTAAQFCGDSKQLLLGAKYFTKPPKSVVDKIKEIYDLGQKDENELCIKQYFVLVFIALKGCLDDSMDINSINKITKNLFSRQIQTTSRDLIEAANSMLGIFVAYTGKHYIYVHPSLSKAVFVSSNYCANLLTIQGSIQDIEDCLRSCNYEPVEDELVITLESKDTQTYHILCERLTSEARKDRDLTKEIFRYMYTYFIKLRDTTFVNVLFKHLNMLHFRVPTENKSYTVTEFLSMWEIIILLDGLTENGKDPWIYYSKMLPDYIIQCGLIAACKGEYLKDVSRKGTLETLMTILKEKLKSEVFVNSLFEPFDEKGNTFFHYITLYGEAESCGILNDVNILLSKDNRKKIGRPNKMGVTPFQTAAYMRKLEIYKRLFVKTNLIEERFLQVDRDGMNYQKSSEFDFDVNFEKDVLTSLRRKEQNTEFVEMFPVEHRDLVLG